MTDLTRQLAARKVERRRQLAALPVGEKLRLLEQMVAAAKAVSATRPPAPAIPSRRRSGTRQRSEAPPHRCLSRLVQCVFLDRRGFGRPIRPIANQIFSSIVPE